MNTNARPNTPRRWLIANVGYPMEFLVMRHFSPLLLGLLGLFAGPLSASERYLPTELAYVGDCVSPRILAEPNPAREAQIRTSCAMANVDKPTEAQACIAHRLSQKEFPFFWDHCGSPDGPFQISINGSEFDLKRISKIRSPIPVTGTYRVNHLKIRIEPGRLLKREYDPDGQGKPEISGEEYEVAISINDGKTGSKFRGVYWWGR